MKTKPASLHYRLIPNRISGVLNSFLTSAKKKAKMRQLDQYLIALEKDWTERQLKKKEKIE